MNITALYSVLKEQGAEINQVLHSLLSLFSCSIFKQYIKLVLKVKSFLFSAKKAPGLGEMRLPPIC
jgi:hypothetical protein